MKIPRHSYIVWLFLSTCFFLAGFVHPADATTCRMFEMNSDEMMELARVSDDIFVGTIISERVVEPENRSHMSPIIELKISVSKVWKGPHTRIKYIEKERGSLGLEGQTFRFMAVRYGYASRVRLCTPLWPYDANVDSLMDSEFGPPATAQFYWPVGLSFLQRSIGKTSFVLLIILIVYLSYLHLSYSHQVKKVKSTN